MAAYYNEFDPFAAGRPPVLFGEQVEPGTFPLVNGAAARVGRLRGYGNAINPWAAKEIIKAYMAC